MSYAICRAEKIKTWSQIKAASEHHTRQRETPNADPDRTPTNKILVGSGDPAADLQQRIESSGAHYRSNSVKGIDMLLTASPEFFQASGQPDPEKWNMENTEAFKKQALAWAQDYFGKENVVSAILHLDESTPHMALMVAPIDQTPRKKGPSVRLNAKKWMDGGNKLAAMQDSFAEAVKDLGLERGIRYSKAKHTKVRQYYSIINKDNVEKIPNLKINTPGRWSVMTEKGRKEFAESETERLREKILPAVGRIRKQANIAVLANKKKKQYQDTAKDKEEENRLLKKKLEEAEVNYKQLADSLRDINLQSVAEALELQQYNNLYCNEACKIKIENNKYYDYYCKKGGGGAIDFVKHVLDCDFKQAVSFLNNNFGTDETVKSVNVYQREKTKYVVDNAIKERKPFVLPEPSDKDWSKVRHYLIKKRGIESNIVDKLHNDGLIYAYKYKGHVNALFVNQSKDFAEKRGIESKFQGLLPSCNMGKGGLRLTKGKSPDKLILVESAIDAMSYYQLEKEPDFDNFIVMSNGGARPDADYIDKAIAAGWKVYCAYDNDKAGDDAFKSMKEKHPQIERERPDPAAKDWNELLVKSLDQEPELGAGPEPGR